MNVLGLTRDSLDAPLNFRDPRDPRNPIVFLDFTVDGSALARLGGDLTWLNIVTPDLRTTNLRRLAGYDVPLPTFTAEFHRTRADRLLRRKGTPVAFTESAFPDGRVGLRYCACGDMDCGIISTRVKFGPGTVTWHDVGWQVTYEPGNPEVQGYMEDAPTFTFERSQYDALFERLLAADWSDGVPEIDV